MLRQIVTGLLKQDRSPEAAAYRLAIGYPRDPAVRMSHEAVCSWIMRSLWESWRSTIGIPDDHAAAAVAVDLGSRQGQAGAGGVCGHAAARHEGVRVWRVWRFVLGAAVHPALPKAGRVAVSSADAVSGPSWGSSAPAAATTNVAGSQTKLNPPSNR